REASAKGMDVAMISGDKDILQAVTDRVKVFDPSKGDAGLWIGPDEVKDRFGVGPDRVIDALALMGGSVDNGPGVRGIGEKTARKLLEEYGDLDGIYAHIDELKGKQKERLIEDKANAYLSKDLVRLKDDVEFEHSLDDYRRREFNRAKLADTFAKFQFR